MAENNSITQLLAAAMAKLRAVGKDGTFSGPGGFNFRGIDATVNAVGPVFRELGIVGPIPELKGIEYDVVTTGKDRKMNRVRVQVLFRFLGPNSDELSALVPGEAMDTGDKATAKAMSVAMRIALLQTLCLPTQEPDPDSFVNGMSELDFAREALVNKMRDMKVDGANILAVYSGLYNGADPRTDTNIDRIKKFTDNLGKEASD